MLAAWFPTPRRCARASRSARPPVSARGSSVVSPEARDDAGRRHGHLRLSLRNSSQLFNSFDPSPFYEKDLDDDAEHFLVSWADELHAHAELRLTLYLKEAPAEPQPERWLVQAIHHHFGERLRQTRAELRSLLRQGRFSLAIGVTFLASCVALAQFVGTLGSGVTPQLFREGFMIVGWVAMWRPLEIYLYDWWPLLRRQRLYRRMSRMPVELRIAQG